MTVDIARAWKDPEYRKSLTAEELASLPPNPAGSPEISEAELGRVSGGMIPPAEPYTVCCDGRTATHTSECYPEPDTTIATGKCTIAISKL
jgi:mersacidin/lichenicidin family type 2 lantibiotic